MTDCPECIAVTGIGGFVGTRLIPRLLEHDMELIGVVRPGSDASALVRLGIEIRRADLTEPSTFGGLFDHVDAIIHLAGLAHVPGMIAPLEAAGVRRGVFVSSAGVYTNLDSLGAELKRRGERALRRSILQYTILRPSMIYGTSADRNLARLLKLIRRWGIVPVPGRGTTLQQPVHVDDLVTAILAVLRVPASIRREYDVGGPEAIPLSQVIRLSADALGRSVRIVHIPLGASHSAVQLFRRLRLPCPVRPEQVLRLGESKAVDIEAARRELDFEPRPFAVGILAEAEQVLAGG